MSPAEGSATAATVIDPAPFESGQQEGGESLLDLIRQLTQQGSRLADQQLQLVKAEIRESASDVKAAVGGMLGAAVVGISGLGVLLMGLAYLLGDILENTWAGTLIVGAVTLIVAYLMYSAASKKMNAAHLSPDRSIRTLERTPDAVRGEL